MAAPFTLDIEHEIMNGNVAVADTITSLLVHAFCLKYVTLYTTVGQASGSNINE